jgi:hypothetical protein
LDYADRVGEVYSFHERHRHGRDWHDYHYRWTYHLPLKDDAASLSSRVRPLVDKSCCNQGSTGNPY